jgi:hypothetical protein
MSRCDFFDDQDGCGLDVVDGVPTEDDCASCSKYAGPRRGLGDTVHKAIVTLRIDKVKDRLIGDRDCGCSERRKRLNQIAPAKKD